MTEGRRVDLLERYEAFLVDLDGVCYLDGEVFEGVPEALEEIEARGKLLLFVTNNSYRTPDDYARFLTSGPFRADPRRILTSSASAARLLRRELEAGALADETVVAAGGRGLLEALREAGFSVRVPEEWDKACPPGAVAVGVDRQFTYERLSRLASILRGGAVFVATNSDATYPTPRGLEPGAGSIVAAVEVASGRRATLAGKPHSPMVQLVREFLGARRALVVGDRPETDGAFAERLGFDSAIVLSGVSGLGEALSSPVFPRYLARSLAELVREPVELAFSVDGTVDVVGMGPFASEVREQVGSPNRGRVGERRIGSRPYHGP